MRFSILNLGLIASTLFFASDVVAAPIGDDPLQSANIDHAALANDAVSTIGDGHVSDVLDRVQGGGISDTVGNIGDSISPDNVLDDNLLVSGQDIAGGIIDKTPLTRRRLSELLQRRAKPVTAEDNAAPAAGAVEATKKAAGATDRAAVKTTGGSSDPEDEEEPDEEEIDEEETDEGGLQRRSEKDEEDEDEDEKDEDEGGNSSKPSKRGLLDNIRAAAMRRRSFGEPVKSISGATSNVMNPTKRAAASDDVSGPADEEDEEEKDEEEVDEEEADEEEADELGDASPTNRR